MRESAKSHQCGNFRYERGVINKNNRGILEMWSGPNALLCTKTNRKVMDTLEISD